MPPEAALTIENELDKGLVDIKMASMKIDKRVPLPPAPVVRNEVYPWGKLDVGDSFTVSLDQRQRAASAASTYKRRHPGWDYATRLEDDAMRIWRTK